VAVKTYSKEFKLEAVRRMKTCKTISSLSKELGVGRRFLYKWREQLQTEGEEALARKPGQPRSREQLAASAKRARAAAKKKVQGSLQKRIAELERRLGAKQMEVDFFRRTFEHVRGTMQHPDDAGETPSIKESKLRSHSKGKD
jgi:transposase